MPSFRKGKALAPKAAVPTATSVSTVSALSALPTNSKNGILTTKGYSILKTSLNAAETAAMQKALTVTPQVPPSYAGTVSPFKVYMESPTRWYLPRSWAARTYGPPEGDAIPEGDDLPAELTFGGEARPHQIAAMADFAAAGNCGIICLPCGYGKTFTAIKIALTLRKRFLIVVHKEFLMNQWSGELKALVPGIRIGRIQGERCEIGEGFDCAIAMIQTICSRSYPTGMFSGFGLAIFDEAHHLAAEHFSQTLQRIQCKAMLGLTATPARTDGLTKVFEWFLGPICYQIRSRDADKSVEVEVMRFSAADAEYADPPLDWKGDIVRARLINQIADFGPRTVALLDWMSERLHEEPDRQLLVLSDRREHLAAFEAGFKTRGFTSVGYYVGQMKQKDLEVSAGKRIILATFAMAAEGFNVPTLNTVLLATPKSAVEQAVGRVLRQRPEERKVAPLICDVVDSVFPECNGQWRKRAKLYKSCGYRVKWYCEAGEEIAKESDSEEDVGNAGSAAGAAGKKKEKKCMIVDKTCCDSVCPECLEV
jgi:superfamily II DNA or RNA helicase